MVLNHRLPRSCGRSRPAGRSRPSPTASTPARSGRPPPESASGCGARSGGMIARACCWSAGSRSARAWAARWRPRTRRPGRSSWSSSGPESCAPPSPEFRYSARSRARGWPRSTVPLTRWCSRPLGEGFPISAQEAAVSGVPVVLSRDPGYGDYVAQAPGAFRLVEPTPESLCRRWRDLVRRPSSAPVAAAATEAAREAFSVVTAADAHERLYRSAARRSGVRRPDPALVALLGCVLVLGCASVIATPIAGKFDYGIDEEAHLAYVQSLAERGRAPLEDVPGRRAHELSTEQLVAKRLSGIGPNLKYVPVAPTVDAGVPAPVAGSGGPTGAEAARGRRWAEPAGLHAARLLRRPRRAVQGGGRLVVRPGARPAPRLHAARRARGGPGLVARAGARAVAARSPSLRGSPSGSTRTGSSSPGW